MKILIFSWRGPKHPKMGGAEIVTHEHSKAWVNAGHEVTFFTSSFKGCKAKEIIDGVYILRSGRDILEVQIRAFLFYTFSHKEYDLVIDQFHGLPFFTPLFVKGRKLAFIHEVAKEVWGLNPWPKPFNLIPRVLGPLIEPLIFKLFYQNMPFLTVSQSTKDDLLKWGIKKEKIKIIHNGFNPVKFTKLPAKEKVPTITFLGSLSADKGAEDALLTFTKLKGNFKFWVIGRGEGSFQSKLKKMAINLGIKNITFWGYVSENKKFELLARSHLLINPSVREGWGLVVIEGASVGTPTICYSVPGLKDSVVNNKTGLITKEMTPEGLARSALLLLNNQEKYQRISKNCKSWSRKFPWRVATKLSLEYLNDLVKER